MQENQSLGFTTRSNIKWSVHRRWLETSHLGRRGNPVLIYPSSESKGADQLSSYCTADLCLCYRKAKIWFSHDAAHIYVSVHTLVLDLMLTDYLPFYFNLLKTLL